MITTLYSVTNETGKPVARMYGYYAIKNLVKEGRKFTAKTINLRNSKQFKIGTFELTELETSVNRTRLVFGV
ncbi:hypothetical protein VP14_161 [Vibrio phage VPMCC14]|nr:hypothetical protein VP14_161 [Vibrio phage VPMCC14]